MLIIKTLSEAKELDASAMSAIVGGMTTKEFAPIFVGIVNGDCTVGKTSIVCEGPITTTPTSGK